MNSTARSYGISVFALVVAVFVRWLLDPILGDHLAFVTLYVALAIAAWYGGLWPTLLVVVAGGLIAAYAFIPPRGSIEIALPLHRFQLISYVMAGIVIGLFGEAARAAQRRAEIKAEETRQKQLELAAEIAVRKQLEEQLKQRNEELQHANRNKDRFMAFLGHELRNPLTAIHATLEALHVEQPVEGRLERHFQLMARQRTPSAAWSKTCSTSPSTRHSGPAGSAVSMRRKPCTTPSSRSSRSFTSASTS